MRHADHDALDALEPILERIRALPGLKEKTRGIFYRGAAAFLHFHEDPAGFFADLKTGADFERFPINNKKGESIFIQAARAAAGR